MFPLKLILHYGNKLLDRSSPHPLRSGKRSVINCSLLHQSGTVRPDTGVQHSSANFRPNRGEMPSALESTATAGSD